MLHRSCIFCLAYLFSMVAVAQISDPTASFRMTESTGYVRLNYENDLFNGTDQYYTQGTHLSWASPVLVRNPLNRLLVVPRGSTRRFGIALEHNGYTPTSIQVDQILYGDRPFAGTIVLKTFVTSQQPAQRYRTTASLSLGMIGPVAAAGQTQAAIHRWTGSTEPRGWQYQINNDLVINYQASVEKNLLRSRYLLLNGLATAQVGTLRTGLSVGGTLMVGKLNAAITHAFERSTVVEKKSGVTFHFYAQPSVRAVLYEATLRGGLLFGRDSPYTLSASAVERFVLQGSAGVAMTLGPLYAEYSQAIISREFATGQAHHWGGVSVGVLF